RTRADVLDRAGTRAQGEWRAGVAQRRFGSFALQTGICIGDAGGFALVWFRMAGGAGCGRPIRAIQSKRALFKLSREAGEAGARRIRVSMRLFAEGSTGRSSRPSCGR